MQGWLSVVVGGLKSAIARINNISFLWRTRYYDRIVRDQNKLNRIADYIENNVVCWEMEEMNTRD